MKKFLLSIILLLMSVSLVNANELMKIPYKNLKDEAKIKLVDNTWSQKVKRKDANYYVKISSEEISNINSEYYSQDGSFAFSTDCQYDFIENGKLIGYSNQDLKFYDFNFIDGQVSKRELTLEEVHNLFPEYQIVLISEFSINTHSLRVKRGGRTSKILLLNDTDRIFENYSFTCGNTKVDKSPLLGLINVKSKGMLQFSRFGDNTKDTPWFILLVR